MTRVATQVGSPEVIAPDVVQRRCWFQILEEKLNIRPTTTFINVQEAVTVMMLQRQSHTMSFSLCTRPMNGVQTGTEAYLVIDNCFRIVKHKLPIVAVHEAQERHQGDGDLGPSSSEQREGNPVVPIHW